MLGRPATCRDMLSAGHPATCHAMSQHVAKNPRYAEGFPTMGLPSKSREKCHGTSHESSHGIPRDTPACRGLLCFLATRPGTSHGIPWHVTACHGPPRLNAAPCHAVPRNITVIAATCGHMLRWLPQRAATCRNPPWNFLRHPTGCRGRSRGASHETSHSIPRNAPWYVPWDPTTCRDISRAINKM